MRKWFLIIYLMYHLSLKPFLFWDAKYLLIVLQSKSFFCTVEGCKFMNLFWWHKPYLLVIFSFTFFWIFHHIGIVGNFIEWSFYNYMRQWNLVKIFWEINLWEIFIIFHRLMFVFWLLAFYWLLFIPTLKTRFFRTIIW